MSRSPKQKAPSGYVLVRCVQCRKERQISPGEIAADDFPMCDVCYMPMMPQRAAGRPLRTTPNKTQP